MQTAVTQISVLFVDDDGMVLRTMDRCLTKVGFKVTAVESAEAALAAVAAERFDVVITDHNMPTMTGAELIERLLAHDPVLRGRIILTSGDLGNEKTAALLTRTGCRGLQKPFHVAEMALLVKAAAGKASLTPA
jgi:DNA-binding NtrC family response regulator